MVRRIGIALTAASVALFVVAFFKAVTGNIPGSCSGGECLHGDNIWVLAFPGSIFAFVGGVLMISIGGHARGRAHGPKSFSDVDSGAWLPDKVAASEGMGRRPRRWSRTWRNVYMWTGIGELGLGSLFFIAAAIEPEARAGGLLTGGILATVGIVCLVLGWRAVKKDRLHETGLQGEAEIVGVTQTGMLMNNNPYVRLDLVIRVPGHQPYQVRHGEIVPMTLVGRLTSGRTLPIRVDPNHPSHFVIEWERG
jgi:hypothetical protein